MRQASKNKRLSITVITLLFLSSSAYAVEVEPNPKPERWSRFEREVQKTVNLKPHPRAEVVLSRFIAKVHRNGSVTLSAWGVGNMNSPFDGYDFEVDLKSETYMTRRISNPKLRERPQNSSGSKQRLDRALEKDFHDLGPYRVHAYVQTKDPANLVLTETSTQLEWGVSSLTGAVTYRWHYDYCWADPSSDLGTTWYVDHCDPADLWWSGDLLCNDVTGWYHNYDYLDDNLITTAYATVYICGAKDGTYYSNYKVNFEGEDSWALRGSFYSYRYYTNM